MEEEVKEEKPEPIEEVKPSIPSSGAKTLFKSPALFGMVLSFIEPLSVIKC